MNADPHPLFLPLPPPPPQCSEGGQLRHKQASSFNGLPPSSFPFFLEEEVQQINLHSIYAGGTCTRKLRE